MKKTLMAVAFSVMVCLLAVWPDAARAQGGFESVTGTAFVNAVPNDFYLEGDRIPGGEAELRFVEERQGIAAWLWALSTPRDTARKSRRSIRAFLITETNISFGGTKLGVGSYGFGSRLPCGPQQRRWSFKVYNIAGDKAGRMNSQARRIGENAQAARRVQR